MTITRTIGVLVGGIVIMIAVVLIRAESSRLQNEAARLERQQAELRLESREQEIEIARLRNPALIRARVEDLWAPMDTTRAADKGKTTGMDRGLPPRTGKRGNEVRPPAKSPAGKPERTSGAKRGG